MSGQNKKMFGCLCLLAMLAGFAAPVLAGVSVSENTGDGLRKVVLENEYWKLVFTPGKCGSCTSLFYKPAQKEFTGDTGVFSDYVLEQPMQQGDWAGKPYACTTKKDAQEASVTLSRSGTRLQFVAISKTITLTEGSPVIKAEYTFSVQTEAMGPTTISPRYHSVLFLPEDCVYSFAGPKGYGKMEYVHGSSISQPDYWEHNPARGWSLLTGKKSGMGLACLFNYQLTQNLYDWFGSGASSIATIEWFSNPITIEAGKTFRDTWYLIPFERMNEIQDVSPEMVAGIRQEGSAGKGTQASFSFQVWPTVTGKAEIVFRMGRLPDQKFTTLRQVSVELKTGTVSTEQCAFIPETEGTYVVQASVTLNGKEAVLAEIPVVVGKSDEVYVMTPREKKVTLSKEKRFLPLVLKPDYITPHWAWAKPYCKGPTRVLFLMDINNQREIIELDERMDLDYANATVSKGSSEAQAWNISWYPPDVWKKTTGAQIVREGNRQAEELLEKEYDAILISGCRTCNAWFPAVEWEKFTDKMKTRILEKVRAGTGLVVVQPQAMKLSGELGKIYQQAVPAAETDYPARGIPFQMLPALRSSGAVFGGGVPPVSAKNIKLANLGQGKIVFLDYDTRGLTPDTDIQKTHFAYWEYYYSLVIRSLLYAGKKESSARIENIRLPDGRLSFDNIQSSPLTLEISGLPEKDKSCLQYWFMAEDGEESGRFSAPVSGKVGKDVSVMLPPLKAGKHLATFVLEIDGKTADFRTVALDIAAPFVAEVVVEQDVLSAGKPIRGAIRVTNPANIPAKTSWEISVMDTYGRQVFCRSLPASQSQSNWAFEISLPAPVARIHELKAALKKEKNTLVSFRKEIVFPEVGGRIEDMYCIVWSGLSPADHLVPDKYAQLKKMGAVVGDGWDRYYPLTSFLSAKMNMPVFGHINLYRICTSGEDLVKMKTTHVRSKFNEGADWCCLSNPKYQKNILDIIRYNIESSKRYGPAFYFLADEPSHFWYDGAVDACWCPLCQQGFRDWLRSRYGTVENLNRKWGAAFADWADVKPSWEEEMQTESNSFARWADFRTYMDNVYYDMNLKIRRVKDELNPLACFGVTGVEPHAPIFSGNRWEKMKNIWDMLLLYGYGDLQNALIPDALVGEWNGYFEDEAFIQYKLWKNMLCGERLLGYWHDFILLLPDFRFSPDYGQPLGNVLKEVNAGIGTLYFNSRRYEYPIAIHYSHPSAQALYILKYTNNMDTITMFRNNADDYKSILYELGFTPTFITDEGLRDGALQEKGIKILILPLSISLSDAEIAAIKKFVQAGGVVIADCLTGRMDEYLQVRESSPLDEVFGIAGSRDLKLNRGAKKAVLKDAEKQETAGFSFVGPDLKVTTGKPGGGMKSEAQKFGRIVFTNKGEDIPLFITNSYGNGRTFYLNFLPRYASSDQETRTVLQNLFAEITRESGLVKNLQVKGRNADERCEVFELADGNIRLFGLLRPLGKFEDVESGKRTLEMLKAAGAPFTLTFTEKAHLYDLRKQKYLGFDSVFNTILAPGIAGAFAQMPFMVKKVQLSLNKKVVAPGDIVEGNVVLQTSGQPIGKEKLVIRVDVYEPDGRKSEAYARRQAFSGNECPVSIPLALNDPKGKWKITVTEAISGLQAEDKFIVK